jgi:HK97 family phage major capsid protein
MIKASNELLADQQASMDAFLVNVLGRGLAKIENEYVVTGSGSAQPLGIQAGGTAGITFAGAAALTIADVLGLFFALPEPYTVGSPGPVWVMKNATLALIRALTTTNFAFNQVEQAGSSQSGAMLYGYPVIVSAAMPAATTGLKSVSLVNFASSTVLVERSGLVVSRNPYLYEEYGQTAIFSTARFGFSVTTAEGAIYGTQA